MHAALRKPARFLDASSKGVRTVAMSPADTLPRPFLNSRGGLSMNRNVDDGVTSNKVKVRAPGVCAVLDALITASVASPAATPATINGFALIMSYLLPMGLSWASVAFWFVARRRRRRRRTGGSCADSRLLAASLGRASVSSGLVARVSDRNGGAGSRLLTVRRQHDPNSGMMIGIDA